MQTMLDIRSKGKMPEHSLFIIQPNNCYAGLKTLFGAWELQRLSYLLFP